MRQDPPFDLGYITATHLLERIEAETLVVNVTEQISAAELEAELEEAEAEAGIEREESDEEAAEAADGGAEGGADGGAEAGAGDDDAQGGDQE